MEEANFPLGAFKLRLKAGFKVMGIEPTEGPRHNQFWATVREQRTGVAFLAGTTSVLCKAKVQPG
jgi:hypothetical protein